MTKKRRDQEELLRRVDAMAKAQKVDRAKMLAAVISYWLSEGRPSPGKPSSDADSRSADPNRPSEPARASRPVRPAETGAAQTPPRDRRPVKKRITPAAVRDLLEKRRRAMPKEEA